MKSTRRTTRDIVINMLEHWGEWERLGEYSSLAERSILGHLFKNGPGASCGAFCPSIPAALLIPIDVTHVSRILADIRADCRAGERYYQAIRIRFVWGKTSSGNMVLTRAIDVVEKNFSKTLATSDIRAYGFR